MVEIGYNEYATQALSGITKGAFLTVHDAGKDNVMTISWGGIGFMWRVPVVNVLVRYSRNTYPMLENSAEFGLSIPLEGSFKEELKLCGTLSGRDTDKWERANLTKLPAPNIKAPFVDDCEIYYECRVIAKAKLEPDMIDSKLNEKFYNNDDYHVLYYGEILRTYVKRKGD